jgi:hypothetical protein
MYDFYLIIIIFFYVQIDFSGELTQGRLYPDKLMQALLSNYLLYKDTNSVHNILRSLQEKSKELDRDWIGKFLTKLVSTRKWEVDVTCIEGIVKVRKGLFLTLIHFFNMNVGVI